MMALMRPCNRKFQIYEILINQERKETECAKKLKAPKKNRAFTVNNEAWRCLVAVG
jgi:hypothetical protein